MGRQTCSETEWRCDRKTVRQYYRDRQAVRESVSKGETEWNKGRQKDSKERAQWRSKTVSQTDRQAAMAAPHVSWKRPFNHVSAAVGGE